MRFERSVTSISWIPSEAIEGLPKLPFELGIGHYDEPPPDRLDAGDLEMLRADDRFRYDTAARPFASSPRARRRLAATRQVYRPLQAQRVVLALREARRRPR